jgi:ribosomal protein L14E/L6E/L27E
MGIFKSGKVVIILAGRFAGRKAVVVKASKKDRR